MKKILCPVDFSDASRNGVDYAANLAQKLQAELVLVQIYQTAAVQEIIKIGIGEEVKNEKTLKISKQLRAYCSAVEEEFNIKCYSEVNTYVSEIDSALKEEVEKQEFDYMVMGTNGAENLDQFFFGTNSYNVLRKIKSPMFIIPEETAFTELKTAVYATNYNNHDIFHLEKTLQLLDLFDGKLIVLHVSLKDTTEEQKAFNAFKEQVQNKLKKEDQVSFKRLINHDEIDAIDKFVYANDADLLVFSTKSYNLVENFFHDSTIKEFTIIGTYPMLVYNKQIS